MPANENNTDALLRLVDEPTRERLEADVDGGYLHWAYDNHTAALLDPRDRVAVILYPAAAGEPYGDFEMADWYAERIAG